MTRRCCQADGFFNGGNSKVPVGEVFSCLSFYSPLRHLFGVALQSKNNMKLDIQWMRERPDTMPNAFPAWKLPLTKHNQRSTMVCGTREIIYPFYQKG